MPELFELQRDLACALGERLVPARAARRLVGEAGQVERQIAVYKSNIAASAGKALGAAYPVISQVVGAEFFAALASAYRKAAPSRSGDLSEFGGDFADFVAKFAHTQSLPYLADLARLEWAVHEAYGARDASPWDAATLASVPPQSQPDLRLSLVPATAVVASTYPIVRIWTLHQALHNGAFDVDWAVSERALVARDGFDVVVTALSAGDAAFIAALLSRATLEVAVAAAFEADARFDVGALLARAVASHLICGFTLTTEE